MKDLFDYIRIKWKRHFATNAADKYPPIDQSQEDYRKEFGGIVDQYLIYYTSKRDEENPKAYHRIVYIDAENDIDWIVEGEEQTEEHKEELKLRNVAISKLDIVQALPLQNLSNTEIINFKKILGVGYNAALYQNWDEVDMAIEKATKYRDDRNKERSRLMLLGAATVYLFMLVGGFMWFFHSHETHPHLNLFWGIIMGAVGAYVSIWMRYGKMDMTGLGTRRLHYLEAFARMLIGAIFATIIIFAFKSGFFLNNYVEDISARIVYCFIGFCAGFSEKFVPSVMESFINKSQNE